MEQSVFDRLSSVAISVIRNGHSLDRIISKYKIEDLPASRYNMAVGWDRENRLLVGTTKKNGRVAIIPIIGSVTKHGGACSYGMKDYAGMIERANAAASIDGIVLDIESPGGTVDGTPEFGMAVKSSQKPVVTFGDNMVASAAYWFASQSDEIIGSANNPTKFGSIGTLYIHINKQKLIEDNIGSVEIIRAPQSADKMGLNPIEPLSDEVRNQVIAELKSITSDFHKVVKTGRGDRLNTGDEDIFTGKMYSAKEALKLGMIDKIGTLADAIDRAGALAIIKGQSNNSGFNANTNMSLFKRLGISLSLAQKLTTEELENLQSAEERLAEAEKNASSFEEQNGELTAQVEALTAEVSQLTETVATRDASITELTAQLEEAPAGHATTVVKDDEGQKTNPYETSVDRELAARRKMMGNFTLN
jgi:protease-4